MAQTDKQKSTRVTMVRCKVWTEIGGKSGEQLCICDRLRCCCSADRGKVTSHAAGWSRAVSSFDFHLIYTTAGVIQSRQRPRNKGGDKS